MLLDNNWQFPLSIKVGVMVVQQTQESRGGEHHIYFILFGKVLSIEVTATSLKQIQTNNYSNIVEQLYTP